MKRRTTLFAGIALCAVCSPVLVLLIFAGTASVNAAEKTLTDELQALDAMRNGLSTPTDEVEARGKALLEKYTDPGQRALIHYHLAFIYDQSGLTRPDLIVEHSEAALGLPSLDAAKRLQLYIFLCDAKQTMNRVRSKEDKLTFSEMRRDATNVCLKGLKESTTYDLPEKKPELPSGPPIENVMGNANDPKFKLHAARLERENEEYVGKLDQARKDQETWEYRRILYDQIVYLYLRQPAADEEMRELAARTLPPNMVKVLVDRLHKKSRMRQPKIGTPTTRLGGAAPSD